MKNLTSPGFILTWYLSVNDKQEEQNLSFLRCAATDRCSSTILWDLDILVNRVIKATGWEWYIHGMSVILERFLASDFLVNPKASLNFVFLVYLCVVRTSREVEYLHDIVWCTRTPQDSRSNFFCWFSNRTICDRKNLDAIIVGPGRDKGLVRKKLGRVLWKWVRQGIFPVPFGNFNLGYEIKDEGVIIIRLPKRTTSPKGLTSYQPSPSLLG